MVKVQLACEKFFYHECMWEMELGLCQAFLRVRRQCAAQSSSERHASGGDKHDLLDWLAQVAVGAMLGMVVGYIVGVTYL